MQVKKGDHLIFSRKHNKDAKVVFLCISESFKNKNPVSIKVRFVFSSEGKIVYISLFYFRKDGTLQYNKRYYNVEVIS